jgi:uncharacterized protein (DUF1778 family)
MTVGLIFLIYVRTLLSMNTRMGRPPKSGAESMTARLEIRISDGEKQTYEEAAQTAGMDRSDWIRLTLNAAAKRALRGKRRAR